jgi:hypothetical protein
MFEYNIFELYKENQVIFLITYFVKAEKGQNSDYYFIRPSLSIQGRRALSRNKYGLEV